MITPLRAKGRQDLRLEAYTDVFDRIVPERDGDKLAGALVRFTLWDIPVKKRRTAAALACARLVESLKERRLLDDSLGLIHRDGVREEGMKALEMAIAIRQAALVPDGRKYLVSKEAWARVMGDVKPRCFVPSREERAALLMEIANEIEIAA